MPKKRPTKNTPRLRPLRWGRGYCELGGEPLNPGDLVGWWFITDSGRGSRWTMYCAHCHEANVRAGRALRPPTSAYRRK
jgi:hypothetical protein